MSEDDKMSPDASPGQVAGGAGVRRVNNMPLYIIGGLVGVFLLIMVLVASDRSSKQHQPVAPKDEKASSTNQLAASLAGQEKDGIVRATTPTPPPIPDFPSTSDAPIAIARPTSLDMPPRPPEGARLQMEQQRDDDADRIRKIKLTQMEAAMSAKTSVAFSPGRGAATAAGATRAGATPGTREEMLARMAAARQQIDAQGADDPSAAFQAKLQQIQALGLHAAAAAGGGADGPAGARMAPAGAGAGGGKDYAAFGRSGQEDRWKLDSAVEPPRSRYELRAGFVVPATLISGINSDLPGQIMAQVSQDVYDTASGKWKLIPQGARLVGSYSSDVAYGQARILIAWQRIVYPDGKAFDLGTMPGADGAGYAGFTDKVNQHYFRLFGSAFLMSAVTAGIAISQPDRSATLNGRRSSSDAMSEALGQQLGQVTAQLISKNLSIAPTLEIRPGYRFNVIVTKDMTFTRPYQAFDY